MPARVIGQILRTRSENAVDIFYTYLVSREEAIHTPLN